MPLLWRHQQEEQKRHEHERDQIHRQKDLHMVSTFGGIPCCLTTYSISPREAQATTRAESHWGTKCHPLSCLSRFLGVRQAPISAS